MTEFRRGLSGAISRTLPGMLLLLLVIGVYADPLFFRRSFGGRDPLGYHYPVEAAIHDAYARGRLPVWINEISGGRPLLANPNAGAFYPMRFLLAPFSFPFALRLFPILHWAAAGIGMIVLLRSIGVSRAGAWVGGVTYTFSGVSVSEVFYPNIHPGMALLPWILWGVGRIRSAPPRGVLLLSLLYSLVLLGGDVFTIGLALVTGALWILRERETGQVRAFGSLCLSVLLALLVAAPQWLATALWIPETNRAVLGMKLDEALFFSISPFRLLELLVPFPFGATWELDSSAIWALPVFRQKAMGMFTTLYAGAFAIVAVVVSRRQRVPGARFARLLLLLGLTVSVLPSLVPPKWGNLSSPLPLRYPEKFAVAVLLGLAILTGLAFDGVRRSFPGFRWTIAVGALLALLSAVAELSPGPVGRCAVALVGGDPRAAKTAGELLAGAIAEGGLLWMATCVALDLLRLGGRPALLASLALLTAVPIAANRKIARSFREEAIFAPTAFARLLARADPTGSYRTLGESAYRPASRLEARYLGSDIAVLESTRRNWQEYTHALWDRGTIFNHDFDAGDLSRLESLRRVSSFAASYNDAPRFFGALALRWGVRYRDQDPLPGYRPIGGDLLRYWDEHEEAYPDIRLLEKWREEEGGIAALRALPRLGAGEAVLETGYTGGGRARAGRLRILEKNPENLLLETEAPDPTWLFVLRGFWNHRTVLVDGREVSYVPAQIAFSAIPIPAGRHRVSWRERAPGWEIARWGPVLFSVAAALLVIARRRRNRKI